MASHSPSYVALGSRLRGVPEVVTLGVKPNFMDYGPQERHQIQESPVILYPTRHYAEFFTTMGKRIFPSVETYLYADEKIKQTTLFYMVGVPHPRTRFYFRRHHKDILRDFPYPFIGKIPRSSARGRGVFLIQTLQDLDRYLSHASVAYIQEYIPHERDLRVVLVNYRPIIAYWRVCQPGDFRTNLAQGGTVDFENIPESGMTEAIGAARKCRFNDVGLDLVQHHGRWFVLEANMKYGRKGLQMKGLELKAILREKLLSGELLS